MEPNEQSRRWETAKEHREAAQQLLMNSMYQASASRSYYACFQAMWVAVGDPPLGHWKHAGLIKTFCFGKWLTPPVLPASLAVLYKKLLTLYDLRLDADYRAVPLDQDKAQEALDTANQIHALVAQHKNL